MKRRKLFILIAIFLLCGFSLHAQQPYYRHYTVNDGLASSTIYKIIQDKKGFIWIATENGAQRFDGKTFETFSKENGLLDNTILDLFEDSKGRIWFLSLSGQIAYYNNGNIHTTANDSILKQVDAKSNLTYFAEDKKGTVYISSSSQGVFGIKADTVIRTYSDFISGIKNMWIEKDSVLIIGSLKGISEKTNDNHVKVIYNNAVNFTEGKLNKSLYIIKFIRISDKSYIALSDNKLYHLEINETTERYEELNTGYVGSIYNLTRSINPDLIWIMTNNGVVLFDIIKQIKVASFLPDQIVNYIFEDKEGLLWFATLGGNIFVLNRNNFFSLSKSDGLSENVINDIKLDKNKGLWVGYNNGEIELLIDKKIIKSRESKRDGKWSRINKLIIDANSNLRIGSEGGLRKINYFSGDYFTLNYETKSKGVKTLTKNRNDDLWIGNAISLIAKKKDRYYGFPTSRITALLETSGDKLWIGRINGLIQINSKEMSEFIEKVDNKYSGKFINKFDSILSVKIQSTPDLNSYTIYKELKPQYDYSLNNPAINVKVNDIEEAPDKTIWVATHGSGIYSVKNDTVVQQYGVSNGLSSSICKVIEIENDSTLWLGTNKGLNMLTFSNNKLNVDVFNSANGLISDDVNAIELQGDTVWVATSGGLSYFNKNNISKSLTPPPVYLTKIQVNNSDTTLLDHYDLGFSQNSLNLKFIGLAYQLPEKVSYKYKLENIQNDWIYTSDNNIKYDYLPSGDYTFQVYAKSPDGVWSSNPATVSFHISAPYYQTWWFYSIIAATLLIITGLVFYIRGKQIERRTRKDAETELKLLEGELKALRAQMNPHFMFNALNSIQYLIINSEPETSVKYLSKFSKLMRKVLDHSRHTSIPVSDELDALKLYLEIESLRFSNGFSYTITVDENIDPSYIEIPPMVLQPYVENSIIHGISPKSSGGRIDISIYLENDFLVCSVDDNGVGRNSEINRKTDSDHKSVGMSVTQRRLEGMTELMKIKGRVEIIDKRDSDGNQTGTTVKIFIPKEMVL